MKPCREQSTVVFGVDARYVEHLLVTLTSLARNGGSDAANGEVVVLHNELPNDEQARIQRVGRLLGLAVDVRPVRLDSHAFPITKWISPAAYLRLGITEAIGTAGHALYLDCDLVVLRDLTELLQFRPDGPVAAVRDMVNPTLACGPAIPRYEELGIPGDREYFNSGVMLIDLEAWHRDDIGGRSARFLSEHPEHTEYWDQCALNVVLDDQWTRLPLEYNALPLSAFMPKLVDRYRGGAVLPLEEGLAVETRANVLHFAGPFKPWYDGYPAGAARDRYLACRQVLSELEP